MSLVLESVNLRSTVAASLVTGIPPEKVTVTSVSEEIDPESLTTPLKLADGVHADRFEKPDPVRVRVDESVTATAVRVGEFAIWASTVQSDGVTSLVHPIETPSTCIMMASEVKISCWTLMQVNYLYPMISKDSHS